MCQLCLIVCEFKKKWHYILLITLSRFIHISCAKTSWHKQSYYGFIQHNKTCSKVDLGKRGLCSLPLFTVLAIYQMQLFFVVVTQMFNQIYSFENRLCVYNFNMICILEITLW